MTLKVEFLQFLKGQKKLEEVSIQNEKLSHELLGNYLSKSAWLSEIQHIPGHANLLPPHSFCKSLPYHCGHPNLMCTNFVDKLSL